MKKGSKKLFQKIALERIQELFKLAAESELNRANRYVELARKIAMKYNTHIPRIYQRKFCKHCYNYLVPSLNCRVRLTNKKVVYYCANCRKFMRISVK